MSIILEELSAIKALLNQQTLNSKKVFCVREAAIYMDISEDAVYKLIGKRLIPHSKPGGKRAYFDKEEIDKWLMSNKIKTVKDIEEEASIYLSKRRERSRSDW